MTPDDFFVILGGCLILLGIGLAWQVAPAVIAALAALWDRYTIDRPIRELVETVRTSQYSDTEIMSRNEDNGGLSALSVSQTDSAQMSDRQAGPTQEQKRILYRFLRELGASRERARPVLAAIDWPLDNNLWADAAPPAPESEPPRLLRVRDNGAPERVISFRETDPELVYQPPD